jgi:type VI protein secretion system component VasK
LLGLASLLGCNRSKRPCRLWTGVSTSRKEAGHIGVVVLIIVYLAVLFAVGRTAERFGRAPFWWVALAFVIGFFAFIPLLIVGMTDEERVRRAEADEQARERARGSSPAALATPSSQIKELAELKESGLVTADEFEQKRAELLKRV